MRKAVETGNIMDGISLEWRGKFLQDGSYTLGEKEYRMSDARDNTRFIMNGRKLLKEQIMKNRENNGSLIALPGMPQYRRTRRVEGNYLLTEGDATEHFEDSIGCTGHWLKPGIVYELPYRTILYKNLANVLASGRNVSASGDAWEALRVIPPRPSPARRPAPLPHWLSRRNGRLRSSRIRRTGESRKGRGDTPLLMSHRVSLNRLGCHRFRVGPS